MHAFTSKQDPLSQHHSDGEIVLLRCVATVGTVYDVLEVGKHRYPPSVFSHWDWDSLFLIFTT